MTATSQQLHNVTKGRLQWDRVTILLPSSNNNCLPDKVKRKRTDFDFVDFIVRPMSSLRPIFAKQFGQCGQAGLGVRLNNFSAQSAQLLREWAKNRYGVFDEMGFNGDAQYPPMTSQYGAHPPAGQEFQRNSCDNR